MHTLIKKILLTLAIILSVTAAISFATPAPVHAREIMGQCTEKDYLFGLTPWDCGIQPFDNQDNLVTNIAIIAANVLSDLSVIATYLVVGFVIYGGYLYMFSNGDAGRVASGKRTLSHAFIGLAIVTLSNVIFNTIRIALMGSSGAFDKNCITGDCLSQVDFITNLLNWFIGVAGVVALIFVFIGGISYMTSAGDAGKLQKAKSTITYALIGLAIVALALVITGFVSNILQDASEPEAYHQLTNIAKEITYES